MKMRKIKSISLTIGLIVFACNVFAQSISKAEFSPASKEFLKIALPILALIVLSSIGRELKSFFAKKYKIIFKLVSGEEVSLDKVRVTLNESIINSLISEHPKNLITIDLDYNEEEKSILQTSQNIPFSEYCINTYKFVKSGIIEQLMMPDSLSNAGKTDNLSENSTVTLKDIIAEFSSTWQQEGIPHLDKQMKLFFKELSPINGEFIIGYADRQVLTNFRIVLFANSSYMSIYKILFLPEINSYSITKR
jgi:hypothetical protein